MGGGACAGDGQVRGGLVQDGGAGEAPGEAAAALAHGGKGAHGAHRAGQRGEEPVGRDGGTQAH